MYEAAPSSSEQIGAAQGIEFRLRWNPIAGFHGASRLLVGTPGHRGGVLQENSRPSSWGRLAQPMELRGFPGRRSIAGGAIAQAPLRISGTATGQPLRSVKDEQLRKTFWDVTSWRNSRSDRGLPAVEATALPLTWQTCVPRAYPLHPVHCRSKWRSPLVRRWPLMRHGLRVIDR
jgi:hypothetical protein